MLKTAERLHLLNYGMVEASNLMEVLAIDFRILMSCVKPDFNMPDLQHGLGITKKMQQLTIALNQQYGFKIFELLSNHSSDTVRGLACYLVGQQDLLLKSKLELVKPLANDANFSVREWAWLALRPYLAGKVQEGISLLESWVYDSSFRLRRFATEITRPRGVWCQHIKELKLQPQLALSLLEPLKNDPEKYVQLSVANWLNDAGKDHPNWVLELCHKWQNISATIATQKICKRALRNIKSPLL